MYSLAAQHRISTALDMAVRLHASQMRKQTEIPYLGHLLSVAGIAIEAGADEDETIAAILHDAVEDQGGKPTLDAIRAVFGDRVASIVDGCTDADVTPKPPWRDRKEKYLAHLEHADKSVRLVCAADKLHNIRAILADYRELGPALWTRFNGGRDGTRWYYRSVADRLNAADKTRLTLELSRVVAELEAMVRKQEGA